MRIRTKVFMGVASVLVAVGAFFALNTQAMSQYRDCEADTIIKCGALSQAELLQHYDNNVGDVQNIFAHYGISRATMAGDYKVGTVYQDGRVVVDGKTVATNAYSVSRIAFNDQNGNKPRAVTVNGTTLYEGPNMSIFLQPVDAFVYFRNGQFYKAVLSACGNPVIATPEKPPVVVQPVFTCDSLKSEKIQNDRLRYNFTTATTTKGNAKVVNYTYDYGDGKKEVSPNASVTHTFPDKAGTYTIRVTVTFQVDGSTKTVTSSNCQTTITIVEKPVTPVYRCDNLATRLISSKDTTYVYEYTLSYTAEGGADLTKVTYNFGDGNSQTFDKSKATPVQHTYTNPGTYKTVATLYFTVKNGTATSVVTKNCEASVTIPKKEMCPIPGKQHLPKNSPDCKEDMCPVPGKQNLPKNSPDCKEITVEKCDVPGKENLPKDSPECVTTPPVTPPELPKTGLGDFIGGGLGLGSIIAAGNYWFASRKSLLGALLNK